VQQLQRSESSPFTLAERLRTELVGLPLFDLALLGLALLDLALFGLVLLGCALPNTLAAEGARGVSEHDDGTCARELLRPGSRPPLDPEGAWEVPDCFVGS